MEIDYHKQALPPGFRLGTYDVVRILGIGGFGVTYLCKHIALAVQVAVKEYLPNQIAVRDGMEVQPKAADDRGDFSWGLDRFLKEGRTLARFQHRNIVRVRDSFSANNTAYIVMDYEDGEPLDVLLQPHRTLTESQLLRVLLPVVDGLKQVHAAGFLHRDVKPSNIFVRRSDESPVLLDFGSARQALGRRSRSLTAIVSAGYSPPEQYESGGVHGAWTDIYALSALCYRAITGDVPTEAPRRQSQLLRTQTDPLPKLANAGRKGYSPALLEAVDWGLRVIETERPQDLDEWARGWRRSEGASQGARQGGHVATTLAAAERGVPMAQFSLGALYHIGAGVPKDTGQAAIWYRKAAEQGFANAQYNLAVLYDDGEGVPRDYSQAAIWYHKAAEQGFAEAQYNLGFLYAEGVGVPKNASQASIWYRKAAEQGIAEAQNKLGSLYADGVGVPKNAGQAAIWYRKAADQGFAKAQYNFGLLYVEGVGVPKDAGQAATWFRRAAEQGYGPAQHGMGLLYGVGMGVPKDASQAAIWYRKAADQGIAWAQCNLGNLYALGEGVPLDLIQSYAWLSLAAAGGNSSASAKRTSLQGRMTRAQIADAQRLSRELAPRR